MADAIVAQFPIVTRAEAKARRDAAREAGEKFYYSGRPCRKGHFSDHYVSTGDCVICVAARGKENRDPEKEREYQRAYREANAERISAQKAERRINDRENVLARERAYYHANKERRKEARKESARRRKEKIDAYQRAYREKNLDTLKEAAKLRYRKNPQIIIERSALWAKANPLAKRVQTIRRRARLRAADGRHTAAELQTLMQRQRNKCASCKDPLKDGFDVDHIVPLSKGGSNDILNIQLLCHSCNRSKGAKDPLEWAQANGRLL